MSRYVLPEPAALVTDRHDEDDPELIVLEVREKTTAKEYYISAISKTVAEANPECDPEAPVVICVYTEDVDESVDDTCRTLGDVEDAVEAGALRTYTFPADRLAPEVRAE